MGDGTKLAEPGTVWVCGACGKTSRTRYGFDENNKGVADSGWDESCMLNAVLCHQPSATIRPARWEAVTPAPDGEP